MLIIVFASRSHLLWLALAALPLLLLGIGLAI